MCGALIGGARTVGVARDRGSQACVMIGDIDVVAPIETSFFCLSYCFCNLTCFILSSMESPNFRCAAIPRPLPMRPASTV